MLKRTLGKWTWNFSKAPETYGNPGIFVEGEGEPLTPTMGDLQLMAYAPEMHEGLWKIHDSLSKSLNMGAFLYDKSILYGLMRRIMLLFREINVKRQDTDKEARR